MTVAWSWVWAAGLKPGSKWAYQKTISVVLVVMLYRQKLYLASFAGISLFDRQKETVVA